jgi:cytochrome c
MSPFEINKIAAAVLLSGLIAMIVGTVSEHLYHPVTKLEKRGFSVEVAEGNVAGEAPAATSEEVLDVAALMAKADAQAGAEQFRKCAACHDGSKGGPNKVGPNLWGVIGGPKAHKEDYTYSKAMMEKHGEKWDYADLFKFLKKPAGFVPGTKMSFAGIPKPEDRANAIAYLRSLSDNPQPLPK